MRKKWIKPELVNIITVEAGKLNARSAERMGTPVKFTGTKNHLATKARETNIEHKVTITPSKSIHLSSPNLTSSNFLANITIKLTNTAPAYDEGPS